MLSKKLEIVLNDTFHHAKTKKREFMTVEQLLLELLNDEETHEILLPVGADIEELKSGLNEYIESNVPKLPDGKETQPTLGFQRVLQKAVFHVQSAGRNEVTSGDVLVAIFEEKESHASYLLGKQGISKLDVANYIAHSIPINPSSGTSIYSSGTEKSRLENIESKVDQLLSELRDLSEKVQKISDRLGPEEKS